MVQNVTTQLSQPTIPLAQPSLESITQSAETQNAAATAAADFESFLQLLTAQISNQDPLSPLDSTQFVEQLASFTSVEQQIETNTRLNTLIDNFAGFGGAGSSNSIGSLANLIGEYVSTPETSAQFNGEPITFFVQPNAIPAGATAQIVDSSGQTVRTLPITENGIFVWDGQADNGVVSANENYSLNLTNTNSEGEEQIIGLGVTLARVTQISLDGDQPSLRLNNGEDITLQMVSGLFDAETLGKVDT